MRRWIVTAVAVLAVSTAACGREEQPPAAVTGTGSNAMESRPEVAQPSSAQAASLGPKETIRAFSEAVQKKDAEGVKRLLTKGSLAMLEGGASAKGMTVDQFIREGGDMPFEEMPEVGAERIEGDTAKVDVRYRGESDTVTLERVDGVWKLAFDKG